VVPTLHRGPQHVGPTPEPVVLVAEELEFGQLVSHLAAAVAVGEVRD
jgi:hypothetical protein